jgi:uncharacterized membrane protein SpoIIM required for sporulation
VTLDAFSAGRRAAWDELEALVERAGRRPDRLGARDVRRLGSLYRSAAADLAVARRRFPGDPVVDRLAALVGRARHLVYDAPATRGSLRTFLATGYWREVAARPRVLALAALLLFGPGLATALWAADSPETAQGIVPAAFRSVSEPRETTDLGLSVGENTAFSAQIFTNNIRVTLVALAGGVTGGLLTAGVTVYNGIILGGVAGLAVAAGNGRPLAELVVPHGVLELTCIVVAAAAGLRLGAALLEPGRRRRADALVEEGRRTVMIVLGTAPWLVLAGLVEGFYTPRGEGLPAALAVGLGLGALYWVLLLWRGRAPAVSGAGGSDSDQSRARSLARR